MQIGTRFFIVVMAISIAVLFSCSEKVVSTSSTSTSVSEKDRWNDQPSSSTNKIRLTTSLQKEELQRIFLERLQRHRFVIDTNRSLYPITTKIKRVENYYAQYYVDIKDGVVIIYGRAGNLGLNGTMGGNEPAEHNINWREINLNGRGWEFMNAISILKDSKKEYN